jgi:hypothetical protein
VVSQNPRPDSLSKFEARSPEFCLSEAPHLPKFPLDVKAAAFYSLSQAVGFGLRELPAFEPAPKPTCRHQD